MMTVLEMGITQETVGGMRVIIIDRHTAFGDTSRNSRSRWQVTDATIDQRVLSVGRSKREAVANAESMLAVANAESMLDYLFGFVSLH